MHLTHHLLNDAVTTGTLTLVPEQNAIQGYLHSAHGMSGGFPLYFVICTSASHGRRVACGASWARSPQYHGLRRKSGRGARRCLGRCARGGAGRCLARVGGWRGSEPRGGAHTWDFPTVQKAAVDAWNKRLNSIVVYATPDMDTDTTTFYSALHHAFVMPGIYTTPTAYTYLGQTMTASGFQFVNDISGWDVYRSLARHGHRHDHLLLRASCAP